MKTATPADAFAQLAAVDLATVPVLSTVRGLPRKDRAALARGLFRKLGIKGIGVTAPNYSMAHSVDVRLPDMGGHDLTRWPHYHDRHCCSAPNGHNEENRCPACRDRAAAERKVEAILLTAFPNSDDRSDTQSDYFDFCWSIN